MQTGPLEEKKKLVPYVLLIGLPLLDTELSVIRRHATSPLTLSFNRFRLITCVRARKLAIDAILIEL